MNATAKFYLAFFAVLAVLVAVSFALGYRAGFDKATRDAHARVPYKTSITNRS